MIAMNDQPQEDAMTTKPIIFSAPMILALLEGRKTQTRRMIKPQPADNAQIKCSVSYADTNKPMSALWVDQSSGNDMFNCPYGKPGDLLWAIQILPIAFGEGKYGVGDDGNIYDISGHIPKIRKTRLSHNGYKEINLRYKGNSKAIRVNRVAAEAFYRPPLNNEVCRHIDGDRTNNRPENLDWGTPSQNTADANAIGAWSGTKNSGAKLSENDINLIRESSDTQPVLSDRYSVHQSTISKIKSGKRWRDNHPDAPKRNMPPWNSRLTLRITDIRVERLQDISEEDAEAEGVPTDDMYETRCDNDEHDYSICPKCGGTGLHDAVGQNLGVIFGVDCQECDTHVKRFKHLWNSINKNWDENPWVWVISFEVFQKNVDAMTTEHAEG